jgi:hypothetical protein
MAIFEFIEGWYNPSRHSAIGAIYHPLTMRTPTVKTLITAAPHRLLKWGNSQPVPPRRFRSRRLAFEQADYQCGTTLGCPAELLLDAVLLPLATSRVSSTLYYLWLVFQVKQDRSLLISILTVATILRDDIRTVA